MQDSAIVDVIRVWAAMAWADGVMVESEADALRRLIAAADLTREEREHALGFITTKVELSTVHLESLSSQAKLGFYRAACKLAMVDGTIADSERAALQRLQRGMVIPDDIARDLEEDVRRG